MQFEQLIQNISIFTQLGHHFLVNNFESNPLLGMFGLLFAGKQFNHDIPALTHGLGF